MALRISTRLRRWGTNVPGTHLREGEAGYNVFLGGTMEDTQRSQPISTESQRIAEEADHDLGKVDIALSQDDFSPVLIGV